MSKRRVVVTGLGTLCPLGIGIDESWNALLAGKSGVDTITRFDAHGYPSTIAGEVNDFDPMVFLEAKESRRMDRFIQFGVVAGMEAIKDSGIEINDTNAHRFGAYVGAGIGGVETIEKTAGSFAEKGHKKVSPFYIPMSIINMVSGNLSIMYGLKGPNLSVVTACTTGTHAIGESGRLIEYGDADVMVCGGTESSLTPSSVAGFSSARALSRRNDDPQAASRPWDLERDGFVMGEGAGVVVLEELEHAKSRGAKIYAELVGFGMSGDAYHITSPTPEGEGATRCMNNALGHAKLNPDQIEYVNAHGTSTPLGDIAETRALKNTFGSHAKNLAVSSIKSMTGHLLGAAGGVEAVATILSIYHQKIPPTINLHHIDPECDLDYVPNVARDLLIENAISNSFGFGGTNGTLVFSKFN